MNKFLKKIDEIIDLENDDIEIDNVVLKISRDVLEQFNLYMSEFNPTRTYDKNIHPKLKDIDDEVALVRGNTTFIIKIK